jgi:hypothetical protein
LRYVLNNNWYAATDNMMFIRHELDRHFIMALKSNRKVAFSVQDKSQRRYHTVSTLDLPEGTVREVYLESVDFPCCSPSNSSQTETVVQAAFIW